MKMIEISRLSNGAHRNQTLNGSMPCPEGWAVVPAGLDTPNFPFGDVTVAEIDGVKTVTSWTPLPIPEPEPEPEPVTELEQLRADVDYLLMMEEG
jgi:hypothetical protein